MPAPVATRNAAADAVGALGTWISVHTGDPSTTGANEATGGSPAYARKAGSTGSASSGTYTYTEVTFDVPAGTYTHFGLWTASTSGTFVGGNALSASQTFSSQGQLKVTVTIPVTAT